MTIRATIAGEPDELRERMPAFRDLGIIVLIRVQHVALIIRLALFDRLGVVTILKVCVAVCRVEQQQQGVDGVADALAQAG